MHITYISLSIDSVNYSNGKTRTNYFGHVYTFADAGVAQSFPNHVLPNEKYRSSSFSIVSKHCNGPLLSPVFRSIKIQYFFNGILMIMEVLHCYAQ